MVRFCWWCLVSGLFLFLFHCGVSTCDLFAEVCSHWLCPVAKEWGASPSRLWSHSRILACRLRFGESSWGAFLSVSSISYFMQLLPHLSIERKACRLLSWFQYLSLLERCAASDESSSFQLCVFFGGYFWFCLADH